MSTETAGLLLPEICLIATALAIYVAGAFVESPKRWSWVAAGGIALAAVVLWLQGPGSSAGAVSAGLPVARPLSMDTLGATAGLSSSAGNTVGQANRGTPSFSSADPLADDALAYFARWLALTFAALLVLLSSRPASASSTPEYVGSLLLVIAGLMLVAGAREMILLFLGLELISIPTYILLYLGRRDAASQESAAKYFYLSVLASAMLLYGFSFLYGTTGSTDLGAVRAALAQPAGVTAHFGPLAKVAMVLIFAGLGFKIAAVPFHFYAPDVYQGTTHVNAALLSVLPKAAGLVALVRIVVVAMPGMESYAWRIGLVLAALTMTFGNVVALWQDNLRRLLAYSSIAHAGYMLIGLAVALTPGAAAGRWDGVGAMLFYLCVYTVATIGAFAVFEYLGRRDRSLEAVEELAGLGRTQPLPAAMLAVFMFSLAGIPPLAGFWGKLAVFGSALSVDTGPQAPGLLRPWFVALAILGVLNAAVAAAYYLRIVATMYFRTPLGTPSPQGGMGPWAAAVACAVLVIAVGLYPRPLFRASNQASPGVGPAVGAAVTVGSHDAGPRQR